MMQAGIELVRAGRRRRWTRAEKERLVAGSFEPNASTSDVARRAGLHVSQLFRWRKTLCKHACAPTPGLVPVVIAPTPAAMMAEPGQEPDRGRRSGGTIEIDLGRCRRVRVGSEVDAAALRRVLDVLEG
ncbi:transposase [Methylobacterium sp. ARG-1]|uniref:IS66-like element accessory protein TnpA n=1 Tax=Methylobacterium sp. ARG-1 TaxID=1692501 RepID=UPI000680B6F8|nr:transposase [Methylobacterium sp. ARG-1]KNY23968.1 hypothetical protein AKJ13_05780 [Methylobacterium sp. ARG-1]